MSNRILVVDDEVSVRTVLAAQLEEAGFEVQQAEDGVEAVEMATASQPDLMLLDLAMPGKDGIETMRDLRAADLQIPIVAICGATSNDLMLRTAKLLGAQSILAKPFDSETLFAAVESALRANLA